MKTALGPAILFLLMGAFPLNGQEAPGRDAATKLDAAHEKAEAKASALRKSAVLTKAEINRIQKQLIELAAKRDAHRQLVVQTENRLLSLQTQEDRVLQKLDGQRAVLMDLLAALQRAGMSQPPALAVNPDDVTEAARAALLLSSAAPALKARADKLSLTLTELGDIREGINAEREQLKVQDLALQASTKNLQNLLIQRQALEKSLRRDADDAASRAAQFAAQASNLRELINRLEAAASHTSPRLKPAKRADNAPIERVAPRHKPDPDEVLANPPFLAPSARFTDSRGLLRLPVNGKIAYGFGKARDKPRRSGLVIQARRGAQVTAPFDGRILYSGLFRNLGRLLILSVGNGYHIIIAGLERSYVVTDQLVLAGEPVGELADRSRPVPELYLEFQKDGRPVDPTPWLEKNAIGGHSVP